jgi:hypothetical protein
MNWRLIKAFPKYAIALAAFVITTGLFAYWWYFLRPASDHLQNLQKNDVARGEEVGHKVALLPAKMGWLVQVEDDLYDINTGELIFKNWLGGETPLKLMFDSASSKVIARFERGFKRYNLDGRVDATLVKSNGLIVSDEMDVAIFADQGDVWKAGIDWRDFKLTDEARATSIGGFQDNYFVQNLVLASKSALVVRNMNQLVRVNLGSGEVAPLPLRINDAAVRRSPDGGVFMGDQSGAGGTTLYAFDVATGQVKTKELGPQTGVTGVLWLDKDRCCILVNAQFIVVYDRTTGSFEQHMKLPTRIQQIALPSPSKRFVIALGNGSAGFVDLEKKDVITLTAAVQNLEWIDDEAVIMANTTMDSNQRGTWVMKLKQNANRVSTEPYIFADSGKGSVLALNQVGLVIFGTLNGLFKMNLGGTDAVKFANLQRPAMRLMPIEKWEK